MKEQVILRVLAKAMEFIDLEQANKLKSILETELYNFDISPVSTALVPVNGIVEKIILFLASKRLEGKSEKTLKSYKLQLLRFAGFIRKEFTQLDSNDIKMYLAVRAPSLKNSSQATAISILKSFFSWMENEEFIMKNPMRKIKNIKCPKRVRKYLSTIELELLRNAKRNIRDTALIEFFYSTGCRLDEVYKLNKSDINWELGRVAVIGKGDKERIVFLNAKAKVHLRIYLNSRKDFSEALFVGERAPHTRLGTRAIQRVFNILGKLAGINRSVYPHLMRHTTMTHMFQNGATLAEVQGYAGHDDPSTTQIYAQQDREAIYQSFKRNLAG